MQDRSEEEINSRLLELENDGQAERRVEECRKLGIATLLAPVGTPAREGLELRSAETLREALLAGLARGAKQAEGLAAEPRELAATA